MNRRNKIILGFVMLASVFVLLILNQAGSHRIVVSSLKEKPANNCRSIFNGSPEGPAPYAPGCVCKRIGYQHKGFPFQTNLYDACEQDNTDVKELVFANLAIQLTILATIFLLVRWVLAKN